MNDLLKQQMRIWSDYRFVHSLSSRLIGIVIIAFCMVCYWRIFEKASPDGQGTLLIGFIAFTGVFMFGGQRAVDSWVRGRGGAFQQTSTTTTSIASAGVPLPDPAGQDPIVNPASVDDDGDTK